MLAPFAIAVLCISEPSADYEAAREQLEVASKEANGSQSPATVERLAGAISDVEQFPLELAEDGEGREAWLQAQANLARLHLNLGNPRTAGSVMDAAIIAADGGAGGSLPVARFGPKVIALHAQEIGVLELRGRATLEVECVVECRLIVDGSAIEGLSVDLYLGPHQVYVYSEVDVPLHREVELEEAGLVVEYEGRMPVPVPVIALPVEVEAPARKLVWGSKKPFRKWKLAMVGVSGGLFVGSLVAGIGLTVALGPNGKIRKELVATAAASLEDDRPSNDVNPNSEQDLCVLAQTPPDPNVPSQVTNAAVTEVCVRAERLASGATAAWAMAGVSMVSTAVFAVLLNVHMDDGRAARFMRKHQVGFGVAPLLEGGVTVSGGVRF